MGAWMVGFFTSFPPLSSLSLYWYSQFLDWFIQEGWIGSTTRFGTLSGRGVVLASREIAPGSSSLAVSEYGSETTQEGTELANRWLVRLFISLALLRRRKGQRSWCHVWVFFLNRSGTVSKVHALPSHQRCRRYWHRLVSYRLFVWPRTCKATFYDLFLSLLYVNVWNLLPSSSQVVVCFGVV